MIGVKNAIGIVASLELIRLFLQHVLPAGFHRVRRFGWLRPSAKAKRETVQQLLAGRTGASTGEPPVNPEFPGEEIDPFDELETAEAFVEDRTLPPALTPVRPPRCPRCDRPLICIGRWRQNLRMGALSRAPPPT